MSQRSDSFASDPIQHLRCLSGYIRNSSSTTCEIHPPETNTILTYMGSLFAVSTKDPIYIRIVFVSGGWISHVGTQFFSRKQRIVLQPQMGFFVSSLRNFFFRPALRHYMYRGPIHCPWLGDKVDNGVGLYRPVRLHRLLGRYDNPLPKSTLSSVWDNEFGFGNGILIHVLPSTIQATHHQRKFGTKHKFTVRGFQLRLFVGFTF
jgi:hypothetical protein